MGIVLKPSIYSHNIKSSEIYQEIPRESRLELSKSGLNFLIDIGVLTDNPQKKGFNKFFMKKNRKDSITRIPILLGFITEGLIVRECHSNKYANMKWASYARRITYQNENNIYDVNNISGNINNYIAVGAGFYLTKKNARIRSLYNQASKRDILWIDKEDSGNSSLNIHLYEHQKKVDCCAGIQVKTTSRQQGDYFKELFTRGDIFPDYPIVYFDLGNDFPYIKDNLFNLYKENKLIINQNNIKRIINQHEVYSIKKNSGKIIENFEIEYHFVRGKDISHEIHDKLLYYKSLLSNIYSNKSINLESLDGETISILEQAFSVEFALDDRPNYVAIVN